MSYNFNDQVCPYCGDPDWHSSDGGCPGDPSTWKDDREKGVIMTYAQENNLRTKVQDILLHAEKPIKAMRDLQNDTILTVRPRSVEEQLVYGRIINKQKCLDYMSHIPSKERRMSIVNNFINVN